MEYAECEDKKCLFKTCGNAKDFLLEDC